MSCREKFVGLARVNGPKCRSCVGDSESVEKRVTRSWGVTRTPESRDCWIAPGVPPGTHGVGRKTAGARTRTKPRHRLSLTVTCMVSRDLART